MGGEGGELGGHQNVNVCEQGAGGSYQCELSHINFLLKYQFHKEAFKTDITEVGGGEFPKLVTKSDLGGSG